MKRCFGLPCLVFTIVLLQNTLGLFAQENLGRGKDYQQRDFTGLVFEGVDFSESNFFLTNFRDAKLAGAIFREANAQSATFTGCDARGADFRGAKLNNASLQSADFSKANFSNADLSGVSVQGAVLRGANLSKTKGLVDGTRADFREADLRGANLSEMKDYGGASARFNQAKYDKATRWPRGFDVENSGAIMVASETPAPIPAAAPLDQANSSSAIPFPSLPATAAGSAPAPASGATANSTSDPEAPPVAMIKARLEKEMWGPSTQGGTKHAYQYQSLKVATARLGNFRTDGTPANRPTMVYPVKVQVLIERRFTDGSTREESKDQTYNFFKDEFGDWTYRFVQNN